MLIYNPQYRLFLGERANSPGVWQFPQGGVEESSSLEENVLRELQEELGADAEKFRIVTRLQATHQYEFATPPPYAIGRWIGQQQTFWVVKFLGTDRDIQLDRYHPELGAWKWCSSDEVPKVAEPRRLSGYLPALKEFEALLQSGALP